ncbi:MAG TPA: citryl-CoA lyase, partial [Gammaproteobacteria bacterium]|nr:citryl-CoA lyase [Gammaproteobacteria bacterium]
MADNETTECIYSQIWDEKPEAQDSYAAAKCICAGYDVYGDLMAKARWVEYIYLLLTGERPKSSQAVMMEKLAIALSNPGPRDYSVRSAMAAAAGGSGAAASLIAALSAGAGQLNGAREVALAVSMWQRCGFDIGQWTIFLKDSAHWQETSDSIWSLPERPPGFNELHLCPTPVLETLRLLSRLNPGGHLEFLLGHREHL